MDEGILKRKWRYSWRLVLLDLATLLFVAGIISTVSSSVGGGSAFTLSLILAGGIVEAIRRLSLKTITPAMVVTDLATTILLTGIVSNPKLWGMPFIAATLAAWVIVQAVRYFIGHAIHSLTTSVQVAITFAAIYSIAMSNSIPIAAAGLLLWVFAEVGCVVVVQAFGEKHKKRAVSYELVQQAGLQNEQDMNSTSSSNDSSKRLYR